MSMPLPGIVKLIEKNSASQEFFCNIAISYKGKDRFSAPIPFTMDVYIIDHPGDTSVRLPEGDTYNSKIRIFSLKPISVLAPISPIAEYVTFGFVNTNFMLVYKFKTYKIISQRHINDLYYVWDCDYCDLSL